MSNESFDDDVDGGGRRRCCGLLVRVGDGLGGSERQADSGDRSCGIRVRRSATPSCSSGLSGPSSPPAYLPFLMQDKAAAEDGKKETFSKKPRHCEAEMPLTDSDEDSFLFPVKEIIQYPLPGYVAPSSISFSPDGRLISYLFSPDGTLHRKVFAFEVTSRRQELVICPPDGGGLDESNLSAEEKLRRERSRERGLGVTRKSSSCYQSVDPERELEIITILEQEPLCMLKSQRAPFLIMLFYISELLVLSSLATIMAAGFKGELNRFQPGVRMEIFRLDAWYFKEDLLINPTNYIVKGLNHHRDALVELVASSEYGILHLFSHHQLQFTNLKYSRVEIDEVWFEWAECMLDYI
ncbi:hypothetical protein ZIOFF_047413 [Zingiber officinale]|uniref:Uncharacterized protein n=1 Tax=Zingiber officinale TaxID=94328 RepID=A0A8J5FT41_ZINOF|nr:hypothetical protein ZIOFF_047413 [Zingiber officinale]